MRLLALFVAASATTLLCTAGQPQPEPSTEEQILLAAGLNTDGQALRDFFRERTQPKANLEELLALARQLGDADAGKRAQATAKLVSRGPWAIPALRQVAGDLDNPLAAQQARHCLEWLEGKRSTQVPIAAAKLLVERNPAVAAECLLAFLPFADDQAVLDGVKAALDSVAARPGKLDPALLAALRDPLPLRRAVAAEVLAAAHRPEVVPEIHKLLADPKLQVRLRVALALTQRLDEKAIDALIDLLAEVSPHDRRLAEKALEHLAGELSPRPALTGDDDLSRKVRRDIWAAWWKSVDGPALVAAFRQQTLSKEELVAARLLIEQLGDKSLTNRQRATVELIALGTKVVGLLREAAKSSDKERARRAELCLGEIAEKESQTKLPPAAARLLAVRKPPDAALALLAYVPCTDDPSMKEEIVKSLTTLVRAADHAEMALLDALGDPLPLRRIIAAEALAVAGAKHWPAVRKLLLDGDPEVRLRAATALIFARDRQAVPALIDLAAELPHDQRRQAEELLHRLAGDGAPALAQGDNPAARKKFREDWQAWWKLHGAAVDLAQLEKTTIATGLIVVAELGPNGSGPGRFGGPGGFPGGPGGPGGGGNPGGGGLDPNLFGGKAGGLMQQPPKGGKGGGKKGNGPPMPVNPLTGTDRLVALDRNGQVHWQIENLDYPVDFQLLPGDRVLIAEYYGNRVTERDLKGTILWEVSLPRGPMNVQRLPDGNTFIALYGTAAATGGYSLMEVDKQGKTVATFTGGPGGPAGPGGKGGLKLAGNPRAGYKLADGHMVCYSSQGTCLWLDAGGKVIKQFPVVPLTGPVASVVGNIDVTSKGHILVVNSDNKVVEYDPDGKIVWQAIVNGNRATRLVSGHTLVASETAGVVELDVQGKVVWQYQPPAGYRAVRARQVSAGAAH